MDNRLRKKTSSLVTNLCFLSVFFSKYIVYTQSISFLQEVYAAMIVQVILSDLSRALNVAKVDGGDRKSVV